MYNIENLELVWSVDLKRNIILLKEEICTFMSQNWEDPDLIKKVNGLLYYWVLGVGRPIVISSGHCYKGGEFKTWGWDSSGESDYKIELVIDYKVTSGYKPFQDLERVINLSFLVDKRVLRDEKINQLLS